MIRPTTIKRANSMPSKIVCFSVLEKKPVLLFKSIHLCNKYVFGHRILNKNDEQRFRQSIMKCIQKKQIEEENVFAKPFTYRYILNNSELFEKLGDEDLLVLDERYRNHNYKNKKEKRYRHYNEYELEKTLEEGDTVEILFGAYKGHITQVLAVTDKMQRNTPGTKHYLLECPNGLRHEFKANILRRKIIFPNVQ